MISEWMAAARSSRLSDTTLLVFVTNPVLDDFYLSTLFIFIRCNNMIVAELRERSERIVLLERINCTQHDFSFIALNKLPFYYFYS